MEPQRVASGSAVVLDAQEAEALTVKRGVSVVKSWFSEQFAAIHQMPIHGNGGILFACPVWGEAYVKRFEVCVVPSLLAPENAKALRESRSRLVIFTDELGLYALVPVKRRLEAAQIDVRLHLIPGHITALLGEHRQNRYTMLSAVHNIGVQMACRLTMGFNMMAGDHIYAHDFVPRLVGMSTKYHAIVQSALSADLSTIGPDITRYVDKERRIVVPGDKLNALAWKHLHQQMRWMTVGMNRRNVTTRLPGSTWLAWRGRSTLSVVSPHMNVTYLSPVMCRFAPTCVPDTLDTALPKFMPAGAHIATPEDGLVYIELSDHDKPHTTAELTTNEWVRNMWAVLRYRDNYLPFMVPCEIGIPASPRGIKPAAIDTQLAYLRAALISALPGLKDEYIEASLEA